MGHTFGCPGGPAGGRGARLPKAPDPGRTTGLPLVVSGLSEPEACTGQLGVDGLIALGVGLEHLACVGQSLPHHAALGLELVDGRHEPVGQGLVLQVIDRARGGGFSPSPSTLEKP